MEEHKYIMTIAEMQAFKKGDPGLSNFFIACDLSDDTWLYRRDNEWVDNAVDPNAAGCFRKLSETIGLPGGKEYEAGEGIDISVGHVISAKVDGTSIKVNAAGELFTNGAAVAIGDGLEYDATGAIIVDRTTVPYSSNVQAKLTAGSGIIIDPRTNIISSTGGGGSGASWGLIGDDIKKQGDLQAELALKANVTDIPTKVSELTNDKHYITDSEHDITKQDVLTAGKNIILTTSEISAEVSFAAIEGDPDDCIKLKDRLEALEAKDSLVRIQKNGVDVGTFTLNQDSEAIINIKVPMFRYDATTGILYIEDDDPLPPLPVVH